MATIKNFHIAEAALSALDPKLGALIASQQPLAARAPIAYFPALCRSIIGQQVSVAAAATIFARLESITQLRPDRVVAISDEQSKSIGLSSQKRSYLTDLARLFTENAEVYSHLESSRDDQVITELTAIKGIGLWTAQMFLIFTLQRPDVFASDDIGLQRAMLRLYDWEVVPDKKSLVEFAERWRPYRSIACLHLWRSLANEPI